MAFYDAVNDALQFTRTKVIEGWTPSEFAITALGDSVPSRHWDAVAWSLDGALGCYEAGEDYELNAVVRVRAEQLLSGLLRKRQPDRADYKHIGVWEMVPCRSVGDVVALIDEGVQLLSDLRGDPRLDDADTHAAYLLLGEGRVASQL